MKIIDLKKLFCKHEEIVWDKTKTMSYPEIYHGVCKKCSKISKDGEIIWD